MSVVDVSELFSGPDAADFMRTVVLRRPSVHFANEGEAIASYDPDVAFDASPQPATAVEIASLPEGDRGGGRVIKLYSSTELKMSDGKTTEADVVEVDGDSFRVVGIEPWGAHGYYKVLAVEFIP
jgi:hypothetical protein